MVGVVGDDGQVELGPLAGRMQPHLPSRAHQPLRDQRLRQPEPPQQIERWRMEGRCAQIAGQNRLARDQPPLDALLGEQQRRHQADWAGTDDDHARFRRLNPQP